MIWAYRSGLVATTVRGGGDFEYGLGAGVSPGGDSRQTPQPTVNGVDGQCFYLYSFLILAEKQPSRDHRNGQVRHVQCREGSHCMESKNTDCPGERLTKPREVMNSRLIA